MGLQCLPDNRWRSAKGSYNPIVMLTDDFFQCMKVRWGTPKTDILSDCSIIRCHVIREALYTAESYLPEIDSDFGTFIPR